MQGEGAGSRDPHVRRAGMPVEGIRVDRHRFGPAEARQQQHQSAHQVEVGDRVERQPAVGTRRGIAKTISRPGMRKLMDRERNDQRDHPGKYGGRG